MTYILLILAILALLVYFTRLTPARLVRRIEERCVGLVYVSETDAVVHAWHGPVPMGDRLDFDEWFRLRRTDEWMEMWGYLERHLTDRVVIRAGEREFEIYACGIFKGEVVGIWTRGVET